LTDSAKEEFQDNPTPDPSAPFDSVVVGLAPACLDYEHLNLAFRILRNEASASQRHTPGCTNPKTSVPLIATHKAKYYASDSNGTLSLGPGPFVTALESAAGVTAEVMGKPSRGFFETVIKSFDDSGHELGVVAVIGDDIEADLGGGASELGFWRVLGELSWCWRS
jgi:ribonucleotide monophosphatase NagD (HAD superfamily)